MAKRGFWVALMTNRHFERKTHVKPMRASIGFLLCQDHLDCFVYQDWWRWKPRQNCLCEQMVPKEPALKCPKDMQPYGLWICFNLLAPVALNCLSMFSPIGFELVIQVQANIINTSTWCYKLSCSFTSFEPIINCLQNTGPSNHGSTGQDPTTGQKASFPHSSFWCQHGRQNGGSQLCGP